MLYMGEHNRIEMTKRKTGIILCHISEVKDVSDALLRSGRILQNQLYNIIVNYYIAVLPEYQLGCGIHSLQK